MGRCRQLLLLLLPLLPRPARGAYAPCGKGRYTTFQKRAFGSCGAGARLHTPEQCVAAAQALSSWPGGSAAPGVVDDRQAGVAAQDMASLPALASRASE